MLAADVIFGVIALRCPSGLQKGASALGNKIQ